MGYKDPYISKQRSSSSVCRDRGGAEKPSDPWSQRSLRAWKHRGGGPGERRALRSRCCWRRCPPAVPPLSPRSARGGSPDPRARWTALEDGSLMVPHPLPPPLPQCLRGPGGARCQSRADVARRPPPRQPGPRPRRGHGGPQA